MFGSFVGRYYKGNPTCLDKNLFRFCFVHNKNYMKGSGIETKTSRSQPGDRTPETKHELPEQKY